jgi:NADH-quinone oxidoreductase subunit L
MTSGITPFLWCIPALPLAAAALTAVRGDGARRFSAGAAVGSMVLAFLLSCAALAGALQASGPLTSNFDWFSVGSTALRIGWLLDPLSASMLVMVSFVGLLIFIFSIGYMEHDKRFARFFCFLALFAAAMLGLIIANSLLLLFACWELVGLASYLLIGFWFQKPSAAAAAKKAFITTRIGDVGFFLGLIWIQERAGTLLFYDNGAGFLEAGPLGQLAAAKVLGGLALSNVLGVLLFCGAVGKSGQVPLHVWLPDAMEGPTPVSALIHAATMVAAGVFLIARVFPLMAAAGAPGDPSGALQVVAWVGAITAAFGAVVAVAQYDIKRILAYSTVSQLGYMFVGVAVGGPPVGMTHLLTHAFFKALLFLGAGSVIHGCHEEQDVRRMGGLRKAMPVTFAAYGVGMLALSGAPLLFSGFWSKDEILLKALQWPGSKIPFVLAFGGAFLTAFYMTRQMWLVFFAPRGEDHGHDHAHAPHESPTVMTAPLVILAVFSIGLSLLLTPLWPALPMFLGAEHGEGEGATGWILMAVSTAIVGAGIGFGWRLYSRAGKERDPLGVLIPKLYARLENRLGVDEFYEATVLNWRRGLSQFADGCDQFLWGALVSVVVLAGRVAGWVSRIFDDEAVNPAFDGGCETARGSGVALSRFQNGRIQRYLWTLAVAVVVLTVVLGSMAKH